MSKSLTTSSRPGTSLSRPNTAMSLHAQHLELTERIVVALTEGRGIASEVGFACINLDSATCYLLQVISNSFYCKFIQVADTPTYARTLHQLMIYCPSKILFPEQREESKLVMTINSFLPDIELKTAKRRTFDEKQGIDYWKMYCMKKPKVDLKGKGKFEETEKEVNVFLTSCANKYFALSALSGLFQYLDLIDKFHYAKNSINIQFRVNTNYFI